MSGGGAAIGLWRSSRYLRSLAVSIGQCDVDFFDAQIEGGKVKRPARTPATPICASRVALHVDA